VLPTDAVCTWENFDHIAVTNEPIPADDQAKKFFRSTSAWAEPDDQFTIEDVQASWNYCLGQFATVRFHHMSQLNCPRRHELQWLDISERIAVTVNRCLSVC